MINLKKSEEELWKNCDKGSIRWGVNYAKKNGLTIDFVEESKMGLKQKRLAFINQKESARCGCGESFQMAR